MTAPALPPPPRCPAAHAIAPPHRYADGKVIGSSYCRRCGYPLVTLLLLESAVELVREGCDARGTQAGGVA